MTRPTATPGDPRAVERYLHTHIPITRAMKVSVVDVGPGGIRLTAPLAPNINHRNTVFGGSLATIAILSGWTLIHTRLRAAGIRSRIVIQRSSVEYLRPLHGDFEAFCPEPDADRWRRFLAGLSRRGRARIVLQSEIYGGGEVAGTFEGAYVAMAHEDEADGGDPPSGI